MNSVEYQLVLGRRIAQERRRHGLSQPELAAMVDRPVAWVSQLERGIQPIDSPRVLKTVAVALDLPLTELTRGGAANGTGVTGPGASGTETGTRLAPRPTAPRPTAPRPMAPRAVAREPTARPSTGPRLA